VDIIRTVYYIHGPELMKLIFAVVYVSRTIGLTLVIKLKFFLAFIQNKTHYKKTERLLSTYISPWISRSLWI